MNFIIRNIRWLFNRKKLSILSYGRFKEMNCFPYSYGIITRSGIWPYEIMYFKINEHVHGDVYRAMSWSLEKTFDENIRRIIDKY